MPNLLHDPRPFVCTEELSENIALPCKLSNDGPLAEALLAPLVIEFEDTDVLSSNEDPFSLVVWNDEVNTFEWVIETLMEVCGHSLEQAEQCAMIIHTKGKYAVKLGSYEVLKPLCDAITDRGIGATIEVLSGQ